MDRSYDKLESILLAVQVLILALFLSIYIFQLNINDPGGPMLLMGIIYFLIGVASIIISFYTQKKWLWWILIILLTFVPAIYLFKEVF